MPTNNFIITIDIGNSVAKACLYKDQSQLTLFGLEKLPQRIKEYDLNAQNTKVILCSVKNERPFLELPYIDVKDFFQQGKFLDMPVSYNETLGIDRLVAAYNYYHLNNNDKLIIDTGTFTTIDYVNIQGFKGGFILPGLNLLAKNYQWGDQLFIPELTKSMQLEDLEFPFPQSTQAAITKGTFLSFIAPIAQILQSQNINTVIFSGGNGEILYNYFKDRPFCQDASIQYEKNLVNIGLLKIMQKVEK